MENPEVRHILRGRHLHPRIPSPSPPSAPRFLDNSHVDDARRFIVFTIAISDISYACKPWIRSSIVLLFSEDIPPFPTSTPTFPATPAGDPSVSLPQVQQRMEQLNKAMENPEVAKQVEQFGAMMQNPEMMSRVQALQNDPELQEMFEDVKKNGMAAMMKYYNDPTWLAKVGQKIGAPPSVGGGGAAAAPQAPTAEPTNLLEAARACDLEAVEDFLAIGKDAGECDQEGRTALHFGAATGHPQIISALIEAGAPLEAVDSKQNTPLHYAAGYGRNVAVELLLQAGANAGAKNGTGKTARELVALSPENPVGQDEDLVYKLENYAS